MAEWIRFKTRLLNSYFASSGSLSFNESLCGSLSFNESLKEFMEFLGKYEKRVSTSGLVFSMYI